MAAPLSPPSSHPIIGPLQAFFRAEAAGGILLLVCAVVAFAWANSPFAASYFDVWQTTVTVGAGSFVISKALLLWINDGLMAIFFLLVGLEIKREVLGGELSNPKSAALAVAAAFGGMAIPALAYVLLNAGGPGSAGWGIPMATDIAFALGVLALLGPRVPLALKVFLTALAIVDDLGAVLVIALFYTAEVSTVALMWAGGFLAALVVLNRLGVMKTAVYMILGLGLWLAFLKSGVHATVAGVLLALTIPVHRRLDAPDFLDRARDYLRSFSEDVQPGETEPTLQQQNAIFALENACEQAETPLARLEHGLHKPVAFLIIPIFALANAGVAVTGGFAELFASPVTLGVVLGLVVGKPIGITLCAWIAVKSGLATLPAGATWRQVVGISALCGIGFTMSIFIATLAFPGQAALLDSAKLGILVGSLVSGLIGWVLLVRSAPPTATAAAPGRRLEAEPAA
jgi:NhaA family Na+:H+ antiporter